MRSASCRRRQPPPPELFRSLQRALITSLPVVVALVLLPALAFASPPDPSWIAGFYDGADGDDVVSLVYETSAAHAAVLSHFDPLPCLLGLSLDGIVDVVRVRYFTRGPRAPPVVSSTEFGDVFGSLPPPFPGTEELVAPLIGSQVPYRRLASPRPSLLGSSPRHTDQRDRTSGWPGTEDRMCHHCPSSIHLYGK